MGATQRAYTHAHEEHPRKHTHTWANKSWQVRGVLTICAGVTWSGFVYVMMSSMASPVILYGVIVSVRSLTVVDDMIWVRLARMEGRRFSRRRVRKSEGRPVVCRRGGEAGGEWMKAVCPQPQE